MQLLLVLDSQPLCKESEEEPVTNWLSPELLARCTLNFAPYTLSFIQLAFHEAVDSSDRWHTTDEKNKLLVTCISHTEFVCP